MQLLLPITLSQNKIEYIYDKDSIEMLPVEVMNIALNNLQLHDQLCFGNCSKKLNSVVKQKMFNEEEFPVSCFTKVGICAEDVFKGPFRSLKSDIQRTPGMLKSFETNTNLR